MKGLFILIAVFLTLANTKEVIELSSKADERFTQFVTKYNKNYVNTDDLNFRKETFKNNLKKIDSLNSNPNDEAIYGETKFADWTDDEFNKLLSLSSHKANKG